MSIDPDVVLPRDAPSPRAAWRGLVAAATEPYRDAGNFAWHYARGKLTFDPVFRHLLSTGDIPSHARLLDLGCGQGLLASLLATCDRAAATGAWPHAWAPPPRAVRVVGIERMARDVARARAALGTQAGVTADFICGDMREVAFPAADVAVALDSLHYVPIPDQDRMLLRLRAALGRDGRLLLRIADAGGGDRYARSQRVDWLVTRLRGHRVAPTFCRPVAAWTARLAELGFSTRARPMSGLLPFANTLLVARVADGASP